MPKSIVVFQCCLLLLLVSGFLPQYYHRNRKGITSSSSFLFLAAKSTKSNTPTATTATTTTKATKNTNSTTMQDEEEEGQPKSRRRKWRVNTHARAVLQMLESRYGVVDSDWSRTRAYIYRVGKDDLTMEQVTQVLNFLDSYTSPSVTKDIVQSTPRLLRKPVDSFLKPTADFLLQLWGEDLFQEAMRRNPKVLLTSGLGYVENTTRKKNNKRNNRRRGSSQSDTESSGDDDDDDDNEDIEQILSTMANLSSSKIRELKQSSPFVFGLSSAKVKSVLEYLSGVLQAAAAATSSKTTASSSSSVILGKLIVAYPNILNLGVESNLAPRIEFLKSRCGFNETDVAKLVQASTGSVLGLSVDQNLKPTLQFLSQLLKGDQLALRKCILAHPQLLGLSLANLQTKVEYFESIGGRALATRVAFRCPAVYSLSLVDNIIPTVDFLAKAWGVPSPSSTEHEDETLNPTSVENHGHPQLSKYLQEYPTILTLSLEGNIQPTLDFFNRTGYTQLKEDWELVKDSTRIRGRYIAASLFNRLLPRWHFCLSSGAVNNNNNNNNNNNGVNNDSRIALHLLVSASDKKLCDALDTDVNDFLMFKQEAIPRLKFSSQFDTWLKTGRRIEL